MKFIQVILEIATGNRIADSHRYYGQLLTASVRDFPSNMGRFVRMIGEDEHHHTAGLNSSHDGRRPTFTCINVSRRKPTTDTGRFKLIADSLGD